MRTIAAIAQVSVPAIELAFGTKSALLAAAIDQATAGDDDETAMLDRSQVAALDQLRDPELFLHAASGFIASVQQRSAGVIVAAREAARTDDGAARISAKIDRRRRTVADWITTGTRRRCQQSSDEHYVTTTWLMIDPALYLHFVSREPDSTYLAWLHRALSTQLTGLDVRHTPGDRHETDAGQRRGHEMSTKRATVRKRRG